MKINDEVVYTIKITGIKNNYDISAVSKALVALGIQTSKQSIVLANSEQNTMGSIIAPRLFILWKGQNEEDLFQANIRESVAPAQVSIEVRLWGHVSGFPQGEITIDG